MGTTAGEVMDEEVALMENTVPITRPIATIRGFTVARAYPRP
jgi:hypothetical protein